MSIAVSVQIKPPRTLKILTIMMCIGCITIGVAIGIDTTNAISQISRIILACTCIAAVLPVLQTNLRAGKRYQVDILASGLISLIVDDSASQILPHYDQRQRRACTLLPSSTLWSSLIVLNLQEEDGPVHTLMLMPDTVSREDFRALSVACRWIASRSIDIEGEQA